MSGWIKLHRSLLDHFLFDFKEPDKALAWIDLLMSASFDDSKIKIKGRVLEVKRGQFCASQVTLQKRWGMSQNKVKRFLLMLQNEGMIKLETNELTSIITICNYESYQTDERAGGRADGRAGERGTDEQTDDIKRNKEIKNKSITNVIDKNTAPKKSTRKTDLDFSKWPEQPDPQTLADWMAMRKRLKADVSQTVINRFATELNKAVAAGFTVDQCIAECCARNWKGFQLAWLNNAGVNPHGNTVNQASNAGRYETPTAKILRLARDYEPAEPDCITAEYKAH